MREIGGYIELDRYYLPMLHEHALALNSARNCLAYLILAKKIRKIALPYFLCDSIRNLCIKYGVEIRYYKINEKMFPENIKLLNDEWLYLVDYYGLLYKGITEICQEFDHVILDFSQAYFEKPLQKVDTIYSCRKFFGVPDGAFLYTDCKLEAPLPLDVSFNRMNFLLGRFEDSCEKFYPEYVANNKVFKTEPIKIMSKLTRNLLHGIDYNIVRKKRTENYQYLHKLLGRINMLEVHADVDGPFAYPLLIKNGLKVRKKLKDKKIFIPLLWPNVPNETAENSWEHFFSENILPIPCDQRYDVDTMSYLTEKILEQI